MEYQEHHHNEFMRAPKVIDEDLYWETDGGEHGYVEFRTNIDVDGFPFELNLLGRFTPPGAPTDPPRLTFHIYTGTGEPIYRMDMNQNHTNPDGVFFSGYCHKHSWRENIQDDWAYVPDDINEGARNVRARWNEFCDEISIDHRGDLKPLPSAVQSKLFSAELAEGGE